MRIQSKSICESLFIFCVTACCVIVSLYKSIIWIIFIGIIWWASSETFVKKSLHILYKFEKNKKNKKNSSNLNQYEILYCQHLHQYNDNNKLNLYELSTKKVRTITTLWRREFSRQLHVLIRESFHYSSLNLFGFGPLKRSTAKAIRIADCLLDKISHA